MAEEATSSALVAPRSDIPNLTSNGASWLRRRYARHHDPLTTQRTRRNVARRSAVIALAVAWPDPIIAPVGSGRCAALSTTTITTPIKMDLSWSVAGAARCRVNARRVVPIRRFLLGAERS
jgi:hypothetical protein